MPDQIGEKIHPSIKPQPHGADKSISTLVPEQNGLRRQGELDPFGVKAFLDLQI
jgi:hypothetical protein